MDGSKGYEHHSSVAAILPPPVPPPRHPLTRARRTRALIIPQPPWHSISLAFPLFTLLPPSVSLDASSSRSRSRSFARSPSSSPPFHPCVLVLLVSSPFLPSSSNGASSSYLNPRRAVPGLLNENLHLFVPPPLPLPPLLPPPPPPPPLTLGHPLASPRQACPFSIVLSFQPATWGSADSRQRTATPTRGRLATYARDILDF